jgi:hypothetical protein
MPQSCSGRGAQTRGYPGQIALSDVIVWRKPVIPKCSSGLFVEGAQERAFVRLRRASGFLLNGQEKVTKEKATKEKATLPGACRATPVKSVRRGRAFRSGILPVRKGADIHVDSPAGLSSTTHRITRGLKI